MKDWVMSEEEQSEAQVQPQDKFPSFIPPLNDLKLGWSQGINMAANLREAYWGIFWQLPVQMQIEMFRLRPNLGMYMMNKEKNPCCIRDPTAAFKVISMDLQFHVPLDFPQFGTEDPYFDLYEWFNLYPPGENPPNEYTAYTVHVGPN